MSPSRDAPEAQAETAGAFGKFGNLNLSVIGLGVEYPPFKLAPNDLNTLVARHYPDSPAYVSPAQAL
jgi:type III polyketide synthase